MKEIERFLKSTYHMINGIQKTRPRLICKDGFSMSVQAGSLVYCTPRIDLGSGRYFTVEIGYPSKCEELLKGYAESDQYTDTIYPYVPIEVVEEVIKKHGGIMTAAEMENIHERD